MSTSAAKKRSYNNSYLEYGFSFIVRKEEQIPQCVVCMKTLSNDSMKPHQLKQHLKNVHPDLAEKDRAYFERKERQLKRARLDTSGTTHVQAGSILKASYMVSYRIAMEKKPHTIGETLIKPCMLECTKLVLGETAARKLADVSLSNDTVKTRIQEISTDIKQQIVKKLNSSPLFAIQLDESTDVASLSQLMVFARYIGSTAIEEEFLFCKPLQKHTTATDVMKLISKFFEEERLDWQKLCGVCTDGAPAMLGSKSGLVELVRKKKLSVEGTHCLIHREALAAKTLPKPLKDHLTTAIKAVNYIKGSALNTRLFDSLCKDMDSAYSTLLYHTEVRWLSKGNMLMRMYELRKEIRLFLEEKEKNDILVPMNADDFDLCIAYLADIYGSLNELNRKLQGKNKNVLSCYDTINAYKDKLKLWISRLRAGNITSFTCLKELLDDKPPKDLVMNINSHLSSLADEFQRYFPKHDAGKERVMNMARDPFKRTVEEIPDELQEQFLELINDSSMKDEFRDKSVEDFWVLAHNIYPAISNAALRILVPFSSTYLCESGFSAMLTIKSVKRNRLTLEDDIRCALSATTANLDELVKKRQQQRSH